MLRNAYSIRVMRTGLVCAATLAATLALAASASAADKLPSGVTFRLKKIDTALKDFDKRKGTSRGERALREAKRRMGEILKGYAKHKGHADVAARQKQIDAAEASHKAVKGKAESDRPRIDALAEAGGHLKALESYMARDSLASVKDRIKEAGTHLQGAKSAIDELLEGHPEHKSHADVVAMQKRIEDAEGKFKAFSKKLQAAETAAKGAADKKASTNKAWIAKLKLYLSGDKEIDDYPSSKAEHAKKQLLYVQEATDLLDAYKQAKFPQGRTKDLESAAARVAERIKKAPEVFKKSADLVAKQARDTVGRAKEFLGDAAWKKDPAKKPIAYDNHIIEKIEATVDAFALIAPKGDPRLGELRGDLALVKKHNRERRDASLDRNLMKPDKYKGKDASAVKAKAKAALLAKHKDAKVLRQTVITPEWQELNEVVKVRDPSRGRDVLRMQITRHVSAQIAARLGGDVFLYTMDVSQERKQDGSWGLLRSHLMFTDRMLAKNVDRDAPE